MLIDILRGGSRKFRKRGPRYQVLFVKFWQVVVCYWCSRGGGGAGGGERLQLWDGWHRIWVSLLQGRKWFFFWKKNAFKSFRLYSSAKPSVLIEIPNRYVWGVWSVLFFSERASKFNGTFKKSAADLQFTFRINPCLSKVSLYRVDDSANILTTGIWN